MPLGFSIIGSTVTFDLFLRWATQGTLGPLVESNKLDFGHEWIVLLGKVH